jgi:serine/threonine-protein kinase
MRSGIHSTSSPPENALRPNAPSVGRVATRAGFAALLLLLALDGLPGAVRGQESKAVALVRQRISNEPPSRLLSATRAEKQAGDVFQGVRGADYVLNKVLEHVRRQEEEERPFLRYLSINHLLTSAVTPADLDQHRQALAKVINHLSWEKDVVRLVKARDGRARDGFLEAIDPPTNSIYAIDLRKLGWQTSPFEKVKAAKAGIAGELNLWDLVLLDYPYGVLLEDSEAFGNLLKGYVVPAKLARPIPYVRADWFCSVVTQAPLYEDMLRLSHTLPELEHKLGVDVKRNVETHRAKRSGLAVSGVSRNNRVVERHPGLHGSYWKTYDFTSSTGSENIFKDPIHLKPALSAALFTLPNGLQGYFLADGSGNRLNGAPTGIVTDKFASDKVVRNGLACMRCHDQGMKPCTDTVRPALAQMRGSLTFRKLDAERLYVPQKEHEALLDKDRESFMNHMKLVLGKEQTEEPLIPVSRRYLDDTITLESAIGELGYSSSDQGRKELLGLDLAALGLAPLASASGKVRRDTWEDAFGPVIVGLKRGRPLLPIDGLLLRHHARGSHGQVKLTASRKGEEAAILVSNRSKKDLYIELVRTGSKGRKTILVAGKLVKAGETLRFPEKGGVRSEDGPGKQHAHLLASTEKLPEPELFRGKGVADRVVHPFYRIKYEAGRPKLEQGPAGVVAHVIDIEMR